MIVYAKADEFEVWIRRAILTTADGKNESFARRWTCVSESSAVIYWQTDDIRNDGTSWVEYGLTAQYGNTTDKTPIPRWSHVHRLTGLKPNTTYHYPMALQVGGTKYHSEDLTVTTKSEVLETN